ncbi:YdcF family protein [Telmatobacter bradus]|uniref:YdcF family protein n=1 Tax=Telmatobacter bradus TaxID=474953 RepID=UPI003B43171C
MSRLHPCVRRLLLGVALALGLAATVLTFAWGHWVYGQIQHYATHDEAAPADAIVVFGAAEYDGHPSPVLRARLDHALALYHRNLAPLVITLGGNGGDDHSEGSVGRSYLMGAGVPEDAIIAETESRNTEESAERVAVIARANALRRLIIVSDGTHLFRIHDLCQAEGLNVLTSPRPSVLVGGDTVQFSRITHEMISYTLWRLHLH